MKILLLLAAMFWLAPTALPAQKMLLLEKSNRARTVKFFPGEDITFRLNDPDFNFWQSATITDILPEEKSIVLDGRKIPLSQISDLRVRGNRLLHGVGTQLVVFGISWLGYSVIGAVFDDNPLTSASYAISGGSVATGFALRRIFKYRKIKLGEKRRLRAIEVPVFKKIGQ